MTLALDKLGTTYDERVESVDPRQAVLYAAATNDDNPAYLDGRYAPTVFAVVPTWEAMGLAVADVVPPEDLSMNVHGEQDMHFHQPLTPGTRLHTRATAHSARVGSTGTRFTIRVDSFGDDGELIVEQYVTIFIRGVNDGASAGPDKPPHELTKKDKVGEFSIHVDDDQTFRYRDASGDMMPIHVDEAFAKKVGLPGIILHGLCTMAMTSQAIVRTVAGGDPARLQRLAVRFASNVFPGNDLVTEIYDTDTPGIWAFEATSGAVTVIKNGLAEIGP